MDKCYPVFSKISLINSSARQSVFWFDQRTLDIVPDAKYGMYPKVVGGEVQWWYTGEPDKPAVKISVHARIRLGGLNVAASEISVLRLCVVQDGSGIRREIWSTPQIYSWEVTAGTVAKNVPVTVTWQTTVGAFRHDTETPPALQGATAPIEGDDDGTVLTTNDTPAQRSGHHATTYFRMAQNEFGDNAAWIRYIHESMVINDTFIAWTAICDTSESYLDEEGICALVERSWFLDVQSDAAGDQQASSPGPSTDPGIPMELGPPFFNDELNNPANMTFEQSSATTIDIPRPPL